MEPPDHGSRRRKSVEAVRSGSTRPTRRPWELGKGTVRTRLLAAEDVDQEKSAHKKTVTMAPRSKYLTSLSQYSFRKPLFVTESQVSILKKAPQPQQREQVAAPGRPCEEVEPSSSSVGVDSLSMDTLLRLDASPSPSTEDCPRPLTTADLCDWSSSEEPGTDSDLSVGGSHHRRLSSLPLDVRSPTVPLRPRWSSTQRSRSLDALGLSSRASVRAEARDPGSQLIGSQRQPPPLHQMSPHQARYWACAIPSTKPPRQDRTSPNWDPNKEYQALLDYTYPLRPNMPSSQDSVEPGSLLWTDRLLQDSGIELDRFCSSTTLSYGELPPTGGMRDGLSAARKGQEHQNLHLGNILPSKSEPSGSWQSSADQIGLSGDSLLDSDGSWVSCCARSANQGLLSSSGPAATFIRGTCILPPADAPWDGEEEFHPLPGRLRELEVLSQHLRTLSLQTSSESLLENQSHPRTTPPPVENPGRHGLLPVREGPSPGAGVVAGDESASRASFSPELLVMGAQDLATSLENLGREVGRESLKVMSSRTDHLSEAEPHKFQERTKTDPGQAQIKESLVQHIQMFCANLEELILWLYKVVEGMQSLTPATADIESIRSCLASYKSFQKDISARQPLTAAVLKTGDALLRCMNSTSPVLMDTLALIERQSQALETHTEHLFSSMLLAMDSLTETFGSKVGAVDHKTKT